MTDTPTEALQTDPLGQSAVQPEVIQKQIYDLRVKLAAAEESYRRTTPTPPATDERGLMMTVALAVRSAIDADDASAISIARAALSALAPYRAAEIEAAHERGAAEERAGRGIEIATLIARLDAAERERDRLREFLNSAQASVCYLSCDHGWPPFEKDVAHSDLCNDLRAEQRRQR